jgi:hypothetical protein
MLQITPIQVYVYFTFLMALLFYKAKKKAFKLLSFILLICVLTEIFTSVLNSENKSLGFLYTISAIIHHGCWLILLYKFSQHKLWIRGLIIGYFLFGILNLLFFEGTLKFNFYTFIGGAFLYLVIFIFESFYQLKNENFAFFNSNEYLLLFSPVLFFFGMSFVLGFKSRILISTIVVSDINLYQFINYLVNIVYYSLINIYIYREKTLKDAT